MKMRRCAGAVASMGCLLWIGVHISAQQTSAEDGQAMAMGSGRMVRGTVNAVAGDKIALKTENGEVYQVALTGNTRLMKGRDSVKLSAVHVGDGIGAMGEIDASNRTVHALFVSIVDAEQLKKMREALGKTWISGRVTAINELKLTILRSDKVTQVIEVDEDTSFKRGGRGMQQIMGGAPVSVPSQEGDKPGIGGDGVSRRSGESITLADIKVGDSIAGEGSLKRGMFVPATLAVLDPSQRHRRQQAGEGPAGAAGEPK